MMRKMAAVVALAGALACSKQEVAEKKADVKATATNVAEKVKSAFNAQAPIAGKDDPAARERERFNEEWRKLETFRAAQAAKAAKAAQQAAQVADANVQFAPAGTKETFKNVAATAINDAPVAVPIQGDVAGPSVLKTQVYLDRAGYSVGVLDGRWGRNSAIALWWFQRENGIEPTGAVDQATFRRLAGIANSAQAVVQRTLTEEDVKGPYTTIPEDVYDQEKLDCLCYESKKEKLAETFHTTVEFLDQLNPDAQFNAGEPVWVPNVREAVTQDRGDIARVVISIAGNTFNGYDASDKLVFHAPTTLGSKYDPSPNETVEIKEVHFDPHFHYQPTLFHEVPDSDPEAHLKPGPNSPVGLVWMALSKPHFGIHGTKDPDSIGYASSHGCVRLANWDAVEVAHRVKPGVRVEFIDTRKKGS
jgi:lipoprotein-anchoring transpeptidase ErfK/SrfK